MLDLTFFVIIQEKVRIKGEKKAGNLVLSHILWFTWLPVQVSSLRLAAASEAALIGILKPVGWQLQPTAASLLVIVFGVVSPLLH